MPFSPSVSQLAIRSPKGALPPESQSHIAMQTEKQPVL